MPTIYTLEDASNNESDNESNISTQKNSTQKKTKETKKIDTGLPNETTSSYWINPAIQNVPFLSALFLHMETIISDKLKHYLIPWATFVTGIIGTTGLFTFGPELTTKLSQKRFINKVNQLIAFTKETNLSKQNNQANFNINENPSYQQNPTISEETKKHIEAFLSNPQKVSHLLEGISNIGRQGIRDTSVFDVSLTFNPGFLITKKDNNTSNFNTDNTNITDNTNLVSQNRSNSNTSSSGTNTNIQTEEANTDYTRLQQEQSQSQSQQEILIASVEQATPPPRLSNNVADGFAIIPSLFIGLSIKWGLFRK